jgi:lysyl-tRNA synthetase class 2
MTENDAPPVGSATTPDRPPVPPTDSAARDADGTAERAIIQARQAKAARLRARGENPYANDVGPRRGGRTLDIGAVRDLCAPARLPGDPPRYDGAKVASVAAAANGSSSVHVRGRIVSYRSTGGLSFLRLRDRTGELQLLVSEAALGALYAALEDMDVGDFVEAEGALTASKRGELSLEPAGLRLVTKATRPLPEKWHGLRDVETRYRQRYVDLVANTEVADVFRARAAIVRGARAVLDEAGFLEVETPTMHTLIGGAAAKPFVTHHNTLDMRLFMRIAPELYLKRLLVGGLERVYEIGRCYRNEGISTRHNPEFTMLEFYQAYATYEDLLAFTEVLLRAIDARLQAALPVAHERWLAARPFTLSEPFARVPMTEAVERAARRAEVGPFVALLDASAAREESGAMVLVAKLRSEFGSEIKEWAKSSARAKAIDWSNLRKGLAKCDNDGERLFALYEYLAEPFLAEDYRSRDGAKSLPVFITDYPFETSPLARRNDRRPEWVDRFELFVHGRELCNAFSELNDPADQADRFREQVRKKDAGAEETMDFDEDYIRALEHGMPPAAGFGMGMDRLTMMLTASPSIRDVILFPLLRPEAP